jgi:hypothetical protein
MVLHHALVLFRMTYPIRVSQWIHTVTIVWTPVRKFRCGLVPTIVSKAAETAFQSPVDIRSLVSKKMIRSCPVAE